MKSPLTIKSDYTKAARIVETLDYIPLAIVHAGGCISQLMISLDDFLVAFESEAIQVLLHEKPPPRNLVCGTHAVFETLETSFQEVQENSPAAADLLLLCSFFSFENIPVEMLSSGLPLGKLNPFSRLIDE